MFALSVVDHLRLDFELVCQNYDIHARSAERLASVAFKVKLVLLVLFALANGAIVVSLLYAGREYQVAAAILAGIALTIQVLSMAYTIEARISAHRSFAHRLWIVCERYRSLLAEIQDGIIDRDSVLQRRDVLTEQVHAIYEQTFLVDQPGYERGRLAPIVTDEAPAAAIAKTPISAQAG
jgi:hypothetical protein